MKTFCFLLAAAIGSAQAITVRASTVIDGKGGMSRNACVSMEGSRITRVAPCAGKATYDLAGMTLMPGWIDAHVHPAWHFDEHDRLFEGEESLDRQMIYATANVQATLNAGFTTVQSVGAKIDGPLRDAINRGVIQGPRMLTSLGQINENSGDAETIRKIVRQFKQDGADVIKIFATKSIRDGGTMSMTLDQINAACGEARMPPTARKP
jgi:imidazolonepropionase-like amidohydrolase